MTVTDLTIKLSMNSSHTTPYSQDMSRNLFSVQTSSARRSAYYIEDVNQSNVLAPDTLNKHKLLNSFDPSKSPSVTQRVNLSV
jgi:hypothetical protein